MIMLLFVFFLINNNKKNEGNRTLIWVINKIYIGKEKVSYDLYMKNSIYILDNRGIWS